MRYLTLAGLLALMMGLVGCGDMPGSGAETAPASAPGEDASVTADSGDMPKWAVLEQTVVHSE